MRTWPAVVLAATALAGTVAVPRAHEMTLADALDQYGRGEYVAALKAVDGRRFDRLVDQLTSEAEAWTKAGDATDNPRRRIVAAAFAVDALWSNAHWAIVTDPAVPNRPPPPDGPLIVIAWACELLRPVPASPFDRWWYRTTVAMLEAQRHWDALDGRYPTSVALFVYPDVKREFREGHLAHARERVPDEPRWRLAPLFDAENSFDMALTMRRLDEAGGMGALRHDELPAKELADFRTNGLTSGSMKKVEHELAQLSSDSDASVRAEVRLHTAYWRIASRDWAGALDVLARASDVDLDPYQRYMAAYFVGWSSQRLDRRADAIAAYRRAIAIQPRGEGVAALLAAQLFLDGQRSEAHALLDTEFVAGPQMLDPWAFFKQGDARFIDETIARMREALR